MSSTVVLYQRTWSFIDIRTGYTSWRLFADFRNKDQKQRILGTLFFAAVGPSCQNENVVISSTSFSVYVTLEIESDIFAIHGHLRLNHLSVPSQETQWTLLVKHNVVRIAQFIARWVGLNREFLDTIKPSTWYQNRRPIFDFPPQEYLPRILPSV